MCVCNVESMHTFAVSSLENKINTTNVSKEILMKYRCKVYVCVTAEAKKRYSNFHFCFNIFASLCHPQMKAAPHSFCRTMQMTIHLNKVDTHESELDWGLFILFILKCCLFIQFLWQCSAHFCISNSHCIRDC